MNRPEGTTVQRSRDRYLSRAIRAALFVCAATIIFSIILAQGAALLAILLFLIKITVRRGYRFSVSKIQIPFVVFIATRIIAIPLSVNPWVSIMAFRTEIPFYGLFFVMLNEFDFSDWKDVGILFKVFFISAVGAALYGSLTQLTGMNPRAESTTSGAYTLGMYLAIVPGLIFPLASKGIIIKPKWAWIIGSLIIFAGLLLTYNRLQWVAAALAVAIAGLLYDRKMLFAFCCIGALLVILLPYVGTRLEMIVDIGANMTDRDVIWKGATLIWDQHPIFGFGLRTFREIFPLFAEVQDKGIGSWHNDFLQVFMEGGILSLAAFLWLHLSVLWYGVRAVRRIAKDNPYRIVLVSLLITMAPFILVGFILDVLMQLVYFIVVGGIAALSSMALDENGLTEEGAKAQLAIRQAEGNTQINER